MKVSVGPVAAASARAFADYARRVLTGLGPGADVASDAAQAFLGYIEEWEEASLASDVVVWTADADPGAAGDIIYAFFRLAQALTDAAGDSGVRAPAEAEAFYRALVRGLLEALEGEGERHAELASGLRASWPGGIGDEPDAP